MSASTCEKRSSNLRPGLPDLILRQSLSRWVSLLQITFVSHSLTINIRRINPRVIIQRLNVARTYEDFFLDLLLPISTTNSIGRYWYWKITNNTELYVNLIINNTYMCPRGRIIASALLVEECPWLPLLGNNCCHSNQQLGRSDKPLKLPLKYMKIPYPHGLLY